MNLEQPVRALDDLSFSLPRNGIVGVIGPNGVGKTTLFSMLVGDEKPDAGSIRVGDTVQMAYVDQNRANLDPRKSVFDTVSDGLDYINVGRTEMPSRAYVSTFGFRRSDSDTFMKSRMALPALRTSPWSGS